MKNKDDVTKTQDRGGNLRRNLKGKDTTVIGRQERTVDEKDNLGIKTISINLRYRLLRF